MSRPQRLRAFAQVAALAGIAGLAASAATAASPAGANLAERWCSQCHAVKPDQASTNPDAPPFAELAAEPSVTPFALRVLLRTPHANMPNLMLQADEMDEITSYILSLKPKQQ